MLVKIINEKSVVTNIFNIFMLLVNRRTYPATSTYIGQTVLKKKNSKSSERYKIILIIHVLYKKKYNYSKLTIKREFLVLYYIIFFVLLFFKNNSRS